MSVVGVVNVSRKYETPGVSTQKHKVSARMGDFRPILCTLGRPFHGGIAVRENGQTNPRESARSASSAGRHFSPPPF